MNLSELPAFEVADPVAWSTLQNELNKKWYGESVLKFSAIWAKKMEARLANGVSVRACAEELAIEVDAELGETADFVYGYAVKTLKKVWKHGEELARHFQV